VHHARNLFWALSLGVIVAYLFFWVLGAFGFFEVLPLSIAVAILALLSIVHGVLESRRNRDLRDPSLFQARERRGF
jgi:uncharacterized membrane protein YgaE (UPF0421/DUF939 family)